MIPVLNRNSLQPIAAPQEPKLAYPEPQLTDVELLALIQGTTFFASNRHGDLMPPGAPHVGLFHHDTRFLSKLNLRFFSQEPVVLSCTTEGANMSQIELTARGSAMPQDGLDIARHTLYIHREQLLEADTLHDVLVIENFNQVRATISMTLQYEADFMDIFQVRGLLRGKSGQYYAPAFENDRIVFLYDGLDHVTRSTTIWFDPPPQELDAAGASWRIELAPHEKIRIATIIIMKAEPHSAPAVIPAPKPDLNGIRRARENALIQQRQWDAPRTRVESDNDIFNVLLRNAAEDFYALQMPESAGTTIAAGVPWFAALFGRDSLIASFEALLLDPGVARGTLRVLASYQGVESDDARDEDPGKILHERRSGEMTATGEVAFGRNYGSVDSTPLFLMLLAEYVRWTGDLALVTELRGAIQAATRWILDYANLDGDGLVEYCRRNPKGLFNQGWKDSGDAIRHADGSIAQPPIALIEVQGYATSALTGVAPMLAMLGNQDLADRAKSRAHELRDLVEQKFWMEDRQFYAMAIDRDKKPLRVDGSNPGHLLFARAISHQRAAQVAARLMSEELFSGWGIRTLSAKEGFFNPMSYHCGTVWPHDTALICYGMARYGLHEQALQIADALYDVALKFRAYRLPELFCGIQRETSSEPVHYPVSCSPQAWASGAPYLMLTGLLGLRPDAGARQLKIVDPHLPNFLRTLRLGGLRVGDARVTLDFERRDKRTFCNVVSVDGSDLSVCVVF